MSQASKCAVANVYDSLHFWCQVKTLLECALVCIVMFIFLKYIYIWRLVRGIIEKIKYVNMYLCRCV